MIFDKPNIYTKQRFKNPNNKKYFTKTPDKLGLLIILHISQNDTLVFKHYSIIFIDC